MRNEWTIYSYCICSSVFGHHTIINASVCVCVCGMFVDVIEFSGRIKRAHIQNKTVD